MIDNEFKLGIANILLAMADVNPIAIKDGKNITKDVMQQYIDNQKESEVYESDNIRSESH